jgi:hypothetical protein
LVNKQWNNSPLPFIYFLNKNNKFPTQLIIYSFIYLFIYVVFTIAPIYLKNMMGMPHEAVEQTKPTPRKILLIGKDRPPHPKK